MSQSNATIVGFGRRRMWKWSNSHGIQYGRCEIVRSPWEYLDIYTHRL